MTKINEVKEVSFNLEGKNTSQAIRYLAKEGLSTAAIYNYLKGKVTTKNGGEIRYQHVRNVLNTKVNVE